jgi:hypothetical protein
MGSPEKETRRRDDASGAMFQVSIIIGPSIDPAPSTRMLPLSAAEVADALAAQGIAIAPGRAERIARALAPLVAGVVEDARALPFDLEAPAFAAALERAAFA